MHRAAEKIVSYLEAKAYMRAEDHEISVYGLDALLYTFISTLGLVLVGIAMGRTLEAIVIIGIFYTNQTLGGGFHASTHTNCFITMLAGLLLCLSTYLLPFSRVLCLALSVTSLGYMAFFPLVLHKNKRYLSCKRTALIKRARWVLLAEGISFALCFWWGAPRLIQAACMGFVSCAVSRMVGIWGQRA